MPAPVFVAPPAAVPTAPAVENLPRESVIETPAPPEAPLPPALAPAAGPAPLADNQTPAPAFDAVLIVFASVPGTHCGTCETVKISVAASGAVLIERGSWDSSHTNWRYERSKAKVGPERAAEFAAQLRPYRATGQQTLAAAACPEPATEDDGLTIDWIAAGQYDQASFTFGCPARRNSGLADALRHAPDVLGLTKVVFPWSNGR